MAEPRLLNTRNLHISDAPERERLQHVPLAIDVFRAHLAGRTAWEGEKVRIFEGYLGRYRFLLSEEAQALDVSEGRPGVLAGLLSEATVALLKGGWEQGHVTGRPLLFRLQQGRIVRADYFKLEELREAQALPPRVFFRFFKQWCLSREVSRAPLESALRWTHGEA